MIDLHSHILFEADDGAASLEVSLEMCRIACADGIKKMVATPHYIVGERNEEHILSKVNRLNGLLKDEGIDLEILPGNEIFIDHQTEKDVALGKCLSLNASKYLLIELPMRDVPKYTYDVFYALQLKGYVPILAHPERNYRIMENPEIIYELVTNGCLMQVNAMSLTGLFGKEPKRTAELLLKHRQVHFVATDAHTASKRRPVLSEAMKRVWELTDKETAEALVLSNPELVIGNGNIDIEEPIAIKIKKSFKDLFKIAKH
jgi:protein-tyrosine phosphatase